MKQRAWPWLVAAALDVVVGGWVFSVVEHLPFGVSVYWALVTAETVGYGDVAPHDGKGRIVAAVVMLTAVPLLGMAYSRLTGKTVRRHMRGDLDEIRRSAARAHRIAADTYRHNTGRDHPDAPNREDTEHDAQDG